MNKTFSSLLVVAVVVAGFILLSRGGDRAADGQTPGTGALASQNLVQRFDFGQVSMAAGKVTHNFEFKNDSEKPLTVKKIYTSCMCTVASLISGGRSVGPFGMPGHGVVPSISETLAAGQGALVETVFDPAAHGPAGVGRIERVVTLETDQGMVSFSFSADVTP